MKTDNIIDALGNIDNKFIEELDGKRTSVSYKSVFTRYGKLVASIVITLGVTVWFFLKGISMGTEPVLTNQNIGLGSVFSSSNLYFILSGVILILGTAVTIAFLMKDRK